MFNGLIGNYLIYIIIVAIIIIGYFLFFHKSSKPDAKPKKKKKKRKRKSADDSEDSDVEELYDLVHKKMVRGMSPDEFTEITGLDDITYLNLQQLYVDAEDTGRSPDSITPADYAKAID